jgi:putative membrane protein
MKHAGPLGAAVLLLAAGGASAETASDRAFLKKAIEGDNSEIMLGKIAQTRGASPDIKDFGAMLVTDHTKAREEAMRVAARIGVMMPTRLMKEVEDERGKLERLSGAAFDVEFARYMVKDHRHDIADFEKEAVNGHGATAALAKTQLPILQKHLNTAQRLAT